MATKAEIESFLSDFKVKLLIWDVLYLDRVKNAQSLIDLDIRPVERKSYLKDLSVIDFSEGPKFDTLLDVADMWIFGKVINSQEVYIKITLGKVGLSVICISFHIAEYPMSYPYK